MGGGERVWKGGGGDFGGGAMCLTFGSAFKSENYGKLTSKCSAQKFKA